MAVETAARALASELGPWTAFERLSALPIALPAWLYAAVIAAPERQSDPARAVRTPLLGVHLLHVSAVDPSVATAALGDQVDALLRGYREPADIFCALLRWGRRRFEIQLGWEDLSSSTKAVVIWAYADCLTDILCSLPLDYPATAQLLRDRVPPRQLAKHLRLVPGLDDGALAPLDIMPEPLLMAGLEFALSERFAELEPSPERTQLFFSFFGAHLEDGRPINRPLRALESINSPVPTWLSRSPADHGPFGSTILGDAFLIEAIEKLQENSFDTASWLYLLAWGPPGIPAGAESALSEVVATLDIERFVEAAGTKSLRVVAEVAAVLCGDSACEALIEALVSFAERRTRHGALIESATDWLPHLLEAGASASKSFEPSRGVLRFRQFAAKLAAVTPTAAALLRRVLDAAIDHTPVDEALDLWLALLKVRAR
jgi:hypothetical protein